MDKLARPVEPSSLNHNDEPASPSRLVEVALWHKKRRNRNVSIACFLPSEHDNILNYLELAKKRFNLPGAEIKNGQVIIIKH